jgi:4-diphosphocytidyl-2-C-methyl-D-erythritol kinase
MEWVECKARAKINLTLDILAKRADGYHNIESVMHTLTLGDTIRLRLIDEPVIRLSIRGHFDVPSGLDNIAWKAAAAMRALIMASEPGHDFGAEIEIVKEVPPEAGLAGGSADAAAVLCLINKALGGIVKADAMMKLGSTLGADVPFLMNGSMAIARGIGELLEPLLGSAELPVAIAKPGRGLSTASMYKAWDCQVHGNYGKAAGIGTKSGDFIGKLNEEGFLEALGHVHNDFEAMAATEIPEIEDLKRRMLNAGAIASSMSGSGTAVYGIFRAAVCAEGAIESIKRSFSDIFTAVTTLDTYYGMPIQG